MEILFSCIINYEKQQLVQKLLQSYKTAIISDINSGNRRLVCPENLETEAN